jgi:hypothetical protein
MGSDPHGRVDFADIRPKLTKAGIFYRAWNTRLCLLVPFGMH